jgi:hypothetical protein
MAAKPLPPIDFLRKLLRYEPETGKLFWLERRATSVAEGDEAGSFHNGYLRISINRKDYRAHRLAWAIYYGSEPSGEIDHINGNRSDNRIVNLRVVSRFENSQNHKLSRTNKTGVVGVSFDKRTNRYKAKIVFRGKSYDLGRFANFEDAVAIRKNAERKFGFHPNHGRHAHAALVEQMK